jgi:hypothetical protein
MDVLDALPGALASAGARRVADVVGTLLTDPVVLTRQGDKETGRQEEVKSANSGS